MNKILAISSRNFVLDLRILIWRQKCIIPNEALFVILMRRPVQFLRDYQTAKTQNCELSL